MTAKRYCRLFPLVLLIYAGVFAYIPRAQAAESFDNLYAAIAAANSGSGDTTITLSADIVLSGTLPTITGSITLYGGGHRISGAGEYRVFDVAGGELRLSSVTIIQGKADDGGAIRLRNGAEVTIEISTLSGNTATNGGAIATSSGSDRLNVSDSNFIGNIAEKSAGAIYANGGTVSIRNSSFEKNCALSGTFTLIAAGADRDARSIDANGCVRVAYYRTEVDADVQSDIDGGAIRLRNGAQASIERSVFSENSATYGGAISTASKNVRLSVNNSSFVGNRASGSGGAIGASWLGGGSISVNNSSFVKNSGRGI